MEATKKTGWAEASFVNHRGPFHDMRTNDFNSFWRVTEPGHHVWAYTGKTRSSNHWIGRSNLLDQEIVCIDLVPGDEIHSLSGGLFVVKLDGSAVAPIYIEGSLKTQLFWARQGVVELIRDKSQVKVKSYAR